MKEQYFVECIVALLPVRDDVGELNISNKSVRLSVFCEFIANAGLNK